MKSYSEIEKLKNYFKKHTIWLKKSSRSVQHYFIIVELTIDDNSWEVLVDDEYNDFSEDHQLMSLFLTLSSLEAYNESNDYLNWCKENGIDPSDSNLIEYYQSLDSIYREIKTILGEIDSCISSMDYQLRTGVIDALISEIP